MGTRAKISTVLAAVVLALAGTMAVPGVAGAATGIGGTAAARGRYFGAAVQPARLTDPVYTRILGQEFTSFTPENALEWDAVEPVRNQFTFTSADRVVDHARAQGAGVRGRGLVSPNANHIAWVASLGTADDARAALRNHVTATVSHFRGQLRSWDVVSEAFSDNGAVRQSVFANRLGPAYLEEAFRAARAADPAARLCYNDFGIEDIGLAKTRAVYSLVRDFKTRGVPIDCVGLESHFSSTAAIPSAYRQTISAFASLGVDVEITELDIGGSGAAQAEAYRLVVGSCVAVPRCTGITVWGVRDNDSWRASLTPLLFNSTGARKPAYYGALSGLGLCARTCSIADPVTTGSVAGTLAEGTTAIADAGVELLILPYGVTIRQTRTDAAGAFRFADVPPRAYALRFRLSGGLVQFHPAVADLNSAVQITVLAAAETTVRESVMPHGTLGGRITTDSGESAPGARVQLHPISGGAPLATVLTGANGEYVISYPPTGQLRVAVAAAERGATNQWAYRRRSYTQADPVTVTPHQHTTVNERLFPSGVVTGRFTRDGTPVANVVVYAYSQTNTAESVSNWTAADGTFRLRPYPDSYQLKFVVPAGTGLDQWLGGAESEGATRPVRVAADRTVVLDERQLPVGLVRGRLTDAAGRPAPGNAVVVYDITRGREFVATTAGDGTWFKTVWPGTYGVRFETGTQVQWATGKRSPETADPVVVATNGTTVVDDVLLP